jgi:hypothetical protein
MGKQEPIHERTKCNFNEPMSCDEVLDLYIPYLNENIHFSRAIRYSFEGNGTISKGERSESVRKLHITLTKELSTIPMSFEEAYLGEDVETGEEVYGFSKYKIFTTPGYEAEELPEEDLGIIDRIKDLTEKFHKE